MCNTMPETSMIPFLVFIIVFALIFTLIIYLYWNYKMNNEIKKNR
jgi:hypothetical protein